MLIVETVETLQLLLPVARVVRRVHVQHDLLRVSRQLPDHDLGQRHTYAQKILAVHAVLKPADRRLAPEYLVTAWPLPAGCKQGRVRTQTIQVVGILVSGGNRIYALTQ